MVIAQAVNGGVDPFTLYAGSKSYIAERISFKAAGAGQVRAADLNPYTLYSKVVGLTTTSSTGTHHDRSGRRRAHRHAEERQRPGARPS